MPNRRLTREDRRAIEAAVIAGRGYAEIARELGRPTSTISREVNRNGGHNHYRASAAHEAAARRAYRNSSRSDSAHGPKWSDELEQELVEMMCGAGFPRMMARVLITLLVSDSGSLTAAELVEGLGVSTASVSKAINFLAAMNFVRRERIGTHRRERYTVDAHMWRAVWTAQTDTIASWVTAIQASADALDVASPAGARLHEMGRFLSFLRVEMVQALQRWSAQEPG